MTRAYLRLDPAFFERKAIQQEYPAGSFTALAGSLCLAESQPQRGRFRDERLLRALLGQYGRYVPFLVQRGDLVVEKDGRVYIDGWDEWQEGDWKVGERVKRIRGRERTTKPVTPETTRTVRNGTDQTVADVTVGNVTRRPATPRSSESLGDSSQRGGGGGIAGRGGTARVGDLLPTFKRIETDDLDELPPAPTTTDTGTRR